MSRNRRRLTRGLERGLALAAGLVLWGVAAGCQRSDFIRQPFSDVEPARVQRALSPEECRADLAELAALVDRATPRPYLRRPREAVEAVHRRLGEGLAEPMTRRQFVGVLREASAAYGIGHQYVVAAHEDFNAWIDGGGRSPSFSVAVRGDALVIRDAGGMGLAAGARLTELGGWSGERLLEVLRARTSADTPEQRDEAVAGRFAMLVWELGLEAPYRVAAVAGDGAVVRVEDAGRVPAKMESFFAARMAAGGAGAGAGQGSAKAADANFSLEWITPKVACLRWTRMDPRETGAWEAFVRQTAQALRDRGAEGLVIDLRGNGGGTGSMARPLLGMISDRPARMAGGKLWRKSAEYDRFLESCVVWWARGLGWRSQISPVYAEMKLGEERMIQGPAAEPFGFDGPRFEGKVVVLIGPRTFSSAVMVADAVATYDLAVLAGRPTGGVPSAHGEVGFARLSRSGLIVSFSSALFVRASGDAEDVSPVRPDVLLAPGASGGAGAAGDAELVAAVELVARAR